LIDFIIIRKLLHVDVL